MSECAQKAPYEEVEDRMQESLNTLFQLQQIDNSLRELEQYKVVIPAQVEALRVRESEADHKLQACQDRLDTLRKDHRQKDRDLQAAQEQFKKYQGQLLSVKTNREYDAMQHEITVSKVHAGEHEEAILRLMEAIDTAQTELEQAIAAAAAVKEQTGLERTALHEQLSAVDGEVAVKLDERKRKLMHIDERVVKMYNRIRKGHTLEAVVYMKKGACGGCYRVIPLQIISEIRKMARTVICERCGRILVPEPES